MKIKINIGKSQLEFEGRDFKEAVKEAAAFSQATNCGMCKSTNVTLDYRYTVAKQGDNAGKGYDYYSVKCLDCGARSHLGEYKTGGFFAKQWEQYVPNQAQNPHNVPQNQPQMQSNSVQNAQDVFQAQPVDVIVPFG
jgi:hypothetical protein